MRKQSNKKREKRVMSTEQKQICWEVHLNGIIVDHVDFPSGMNKKQIRKALLSQGYDPKIRVRKN